MKDNIFALTGERQMQRTINNIIKEGEIMFAEKKKARKNLFEGDQYKESLESENRRLKSLSSELSIQIDLIEKKLELYQDIYALKWMLANQT